MAATPWTLGASPNKDSPGKDNVHVPAFSGNAKAIGSPNAPITMEILLAILSVRRAALSLKARW